MSDSATTTMFTCEICHKTFNHKGHYNVHIDGHRRKRIARDGHEIDVKKARSAPPSEIEEFGIKMIYAGLKNVFKIYRASFNRVVNDLAVITTMLLAQIVFIINQAIVEKDGIKVHLRCTVKFHKAVEPAVTMIAYFVSRPTIYLHTTDTQSQYSAAMANIQKQIEELTRNGSGWVVEQIEKVDLYISKYTPMRGNTYCKLPRALAKKRAIVNIKNKDNKCFMWSVLAALHPVARNRNRVYHYRQYEEELDFTGISHPTSLADVPMFEQLNPNVGINVFGYGDSGLYPLYATPTRDRQVVNLLLITPKNTPAHYCLISNLNRLLFKSTKHEHRKFVCKFCLCHFNTPQRLTKHQEYCTTGNQRVEMPVDPILKFKNVHRQLRAPYVLFADFECFNQQEGSEKVHVPNSYGLLGVKRCCEDTADFEEPIVYRGTNPVRHLLDTLLQKGEGFVMSCNKPMDITPQLLTVFSQSKKCYLCEEAFAKDDKHRDHCHACGKYRGAAHAKCNLTARTCRDVTVLFHNLKKYDGHLIMQELGGLLTERKLKLECTAKGMEDYLTFAIRLKSGDVSWRLRFVDSLAFLPASLDTLVKTLSTEKFTALRRFTRNPDLLTQKGFYPYEKVTDASIFDYPGMLPIEDFDNSLTKERLSVENYQHATHVYNIHEFNTFGEYHDLYLLTDVLLLVDVFENFRDFMLNHYQLDPVHYITLPSLAWDALFKKTQAKLELLQDPDMYQFFTAGIRGGISVISHRHAKANNKYLADYNPQEPSSYIMYMDANNLYGWAMTQKLPVGGFEWIGEIDAVPNDGLGYVLEVDLEYPKELHDQHNDYPLAPEKILVPPVSSYCQQLKAILKLPDQECEKLIPNLMNKTHYIIHHRNLKQYLDLGLKLTKIHRGIRFHETAWMSPYIEFNTEMRKRANSVFEKDLFKLLNNAVFGKSMENVFNYINVKLTADPKQYEKFVASPLYRDTRVFKNDLVAVLMAREKAELNKPIYTGFSVLELSKMLMYDYHYQYMLPKYGDQAKLLFTDTDSLCYHITTEDVYKDMQQDADLFDMSDYSPDHPLYSNKNKKAMGKMKDETNGLPVEEFVGLRAKMYSLKCGVDEKKRAKGIVKAVVIKEIVHEDYRKTLFTGSQMYHTMTQFKSKEHQIYTVEMKKASLSAYDDKRYVLDDGVTTLAYGHKDIDAA